MKVCWWLVLTLPLVADPEETVWYDASGEVVRVESADAERVAVPFVAEWRKREIERREGYNGEWSREMWPVWGGSYTSRRRSYSGGYRIYGGYYSGIRVKGRHFGGYHHTCPKPYRGGSKVIIRW